MATFLTYTGSRRVCAQGRLRGRGEGFALIIALVCMGFMVLLLMSLNLLSSTELAVSRLQDAQSRARTNALLGLQVAIGELQLQLGPDQRISAPAGLRTTAADGRGHWAGAWRSNADGGKATDFLGWLVSLPQGTANAETVADTTVDWTTGADGLLRPDSDEWVALVSNGTVDVSAGSADALVMAGMVDVNGDGHYAWWAGDEGVKARVNLPDRQPEAGQTADSVAEQMRNLRSPSHYGLAKVGVAASGQQGPLATLPADGQGVAGIDLLEQLPLVGADAGVGRKHFHDLTPHSRGLLTDTRRGGLRRDLTHLLKSSKAFNRQFGTPWSESYLFHPPGASLNFSNGAPNWGIMRSFYNLHTRVSGNSIAAIAPDDNGKRATGYPIYQHPGDIYQTNSVVTPVISWAQLVVGLEYKPEGDDGNIYEPYLYLRPLIGLHNPYDVTITTPVAYEVEWYFAPLIEMQVGTQALVKFRLNEMGTGRRFRLRIPADIATLLPGETRFYGLDGVYDLSQSMSNNASLKADWDEKGAYFVKMSNAKGATQDGATAGEQPIGNAHWGLTPTEKNALTYIHPENGEFPLVTFKVNYHPTEGNATGHTDRGGMLILRVGDDVFTQHEHVYTFVPEMRPSTITKQLEIKELGGEIPDLFWFGIGQRTMDSPNDQQRQFIDSNLRALSGSVEQEGIASLNELATLSGWTGISTPPADGSTVGWLEARADYSPQLSDTNRFSGFFGRSRGVGGSDSVVLYHVPREAPLSLGVFQHAGLSRYSRHQGYMVGNSYALPRVNPDATQKEPFLVQSTSRHNAYDWAYAINLELWDRYYLSGIPQNLTQAELDAYRDGSRTLPNPRLSLMPVADTAPTVARLTDDDVADTSTNALAHLLLEGPFNVNSVSVEAWKSLFASSAGLAVPVYNAADGGYRHSETDASQRASFYRTPLSYDSAEDTNSNSSRFWSSHRRLTDAEIHQLATQMVTEVQTRGPFGSLADFVNRRPGAPSSDSDLRKRGALQAALDQTVNSSLSAGATGQAGDSGRDVALKGYDTGYTTDEDRPGTGAPGWLLQGDLLQVLGPLLTARSDTFLVRAYGDSLDLSGNVVARAWCEAVVQRRVEKVNDAEALDAADPAGSFGRRFSIVSFRWIDAP